MSIDLTKKIEKFENSMLEIIDTTEKVTNDIHEKYVSKVIPELGKYGDVAKFTAELIPGVSEYNAIREGDWNAFAISAGIDIGSAAIGTATSGTGYFLSKKIMKDSVKEVMNESSKKIISKDAKKTIEIIEREVMDSSLENALNAKKLFSIASSSEVKLCNEKFVEKAMKNVPVNHGVWTGERGMSKWVPDDDFIPNRFNPNNLNLKNEILKYNVDGIEYRNGIPDFSPFSEVTVNIENFTNNRFDNFAQANKILADQYGKSVRDIKEYIADNELTWHEDANIGTLQLVPKVIHSVSHNGGFSKYLYMQEYLKEVGKIK